MKRTISTLLLGVFLGALLFGNSSVFAAGNLIEVNYIVKNLVINKVAKMPQEKPFVYKGTTYVPLRFISENLGYPVKWDPNTQTIYIGDTTDNNALLGKELKNLNYQEDDTGCSFHTYVAGKLAEYNTGRNHDNKNKTIYDNLGNKYDNALGLYHDYYYGRNNYVEYPLNGNYSSFKAKVGISGDTKSFEGTATLTIYGDEKKLCELSFKAGDFPKDISLDVKNNLKLKIQLVSTDGAVEICLFNPELIK